MDAEYYICKNCGVSCNSIISYTQHIRGRQHKRKMEIMKLKKHKDKLDEISNNFDISGTDDKVSKVIWNRYKEINKDKSKDETKTSNTNSEPKYSIDKHIDQIIFQMAKSGLGKLNIIKEHMDCYEDHEILMSLGRLVKLGKIKLIISKSTNDPRFISLM